MNTLAKRLAEAMSKKGWSQDALAQKSGVSQVAIHKILTGKSESTRKGPQLAGALNVDLNWLLTGKSPESVVERDELSDDQRRALEYMDMLSPSQRAEWFRWAAEKEEQNREVMEHMRARQPGKARVTTKR